MVPAYASHVFMDFPEKDRYNGEKGGEAEARTTEYYEKRPCPDLVALAAEVLGEMLWEKGILK